MIEFYTKKYVKSKLSTFLALMLIVVLSVLFYTQVDLKPKISPNFFFSSNSKIFQENEQINNQFPSNQQLIIGVPTNNIINTGYLNLISDLTIDLQKIKDIQTALSLTEGPEDLDAALNNPLWKRILVDKDKKTSFVICFLKGEEFERVVSSVQKVISKYKSKKLNIKLSGMPYIVEQMRQNISEDMKNYTLLAITLCSLTLLSIYRSFKVMLFSLVCCSLSAITSLLILSFMGYRIGILTANLIVIVYILAQSHLIFLTSNFQSLSRENKNQIEKTISKTLPASFWCMLTTLLGFLSLILVEAKPLKELGISGSIGTITAFFIIYLTYPALLKFVSMNKKSDILNVLSKIYSNYKLNKFIVIFVLIFSLLIGLVGIPVLNTDPSLLKYFKEDGKISEQIEFVDKNGGSNPLKLVISDDNGKRLDNDESYKKMWGLQKGLSKHKEVGSVISLPIIMAEADENWLGSLMPWNLIIDILSEAGFNKIAKSFISEDRKKAVFILRMNESEKSQNRLKTVEELKNIVSKNGFKLNKTGGTYYLQGKLGESVESSIITGVLALITTFSIITLIITTSLKISIIVGICILAISLIIFGTLGFLKVPVDIISSPAINISLGIAVDSIIHIIREVKNFGGFTATNWSKALKNQAKPAIISIFTVMIGFSTFALSSFPPSVRFGVVIVYGSFLAAIFALIVIPTLGINKAKKKS